MKKTAKIISSIVALALLSVAAGSLQAQVTNVITITATGEVQANSTDNGTTTTTPVPVKQTLMTKNILSLLAYAEFNEGNYNTTIFPTGAKLVVIGGNNGIDFQVVDKNNNSLVDVSDIITGESTGNYGQDVSSGAFNDNTGLNSPTTTDLQIFTIAYDDTNAGGDDSNGDSLQFYLTGLMTNKTTNTTPNTTTHIYKQTESHAFSDGAGDGTFNQVPLVCSGSFSASGSANLVQ